MTATPAQITAAAVAAHAASEAAALAFQRWEGVRSADTAVRSALGDAFWNAQGPYRPVREALNAAWEAATVAHQEAVAAAERAYDDLRAVQATA